MNQSAVHILRGRGLLSQEQLQQVEQIAAHYHYAAIKAALNFGILSRKVYVHFLMDNGYGLVDVRKERMDEQYILQCGLHHLNDHLYIPLRKTETGVLMVAVADPFDTGLKALLEQQFACTVDFVVASDLDITWMAHKLRGEDFVKEAVFKLAKQDAASSALITFTDAQLVFLFGGLAILVSCLIIFFVPTVLAVNLLFSSFFLFAILFKLWLALKGAQFELHEAVNRRETKKLEVDSLPVYTVLLPVYKEDKLIRKLIWNLRSLDYPRERLDVKLLIEEDDDKTLHAVRELDFPANFEVIVVPFHMPKTKPKACNYGLFFSKGTYLTIYDAEDVPDADQLKKVVCLFRKLPENFVVLQGALNYFNKNENLLTRMFTLEYSYWFDYMLTGLESLDIPIPLGGTSNHFKLDKLVELGGWDPFNVTEDADLGVRAFAKNYKVGVINSTTLEEANNEPFNWIRQRSRWIKGYMQTYLVHMRNPRALIRRIGWNGFLGFNFFVGATSFTFLVYPLLLSVFIAYILFDLTSLKKLFPDWILFISVFNLIAGNVLMVYVNMLAVFKRRYYELIVFAVLNPVYWLMHSIAAYKGLWQLIFKPFYWEKTNHGLTKVNASQSAPAAVPAVTVAKT